LSKTALRVGLYPSSTGEEAFGKIGSLPGRISPGHCGV